MGRISTELSKLAIERILAVREHLTDDQIKKAREVGEARMARWREGMREGGEGRRMREGERRRERNGDRPPREGRERPDRE